MRKDVLAFMSGVGVLPAPEALDHVLAKPDPLDYIRYLLEAMRPRPIILTMEEIDRFESGQAADPDEGEGSGEDDGTPQEDGLDLMGPYSTRPSDPDEREVPLPDDQAPDMGPDRVHPTPHRRTCEVYSCGANGPEHVSFGPEGDAPPVPEGR